MNKVDSKVEDLGVAIAKTSRFDTKIQNDSMAVLTTVTEKCAIIENLVYAGMKASQDAVVAKDIKAMKENKKDEDVPAVDNKDVNKAKKKAKNRNENGKENSPRQ